MPTTVEEWLRQADYDLETADYMLRGDRRFYSVFMAHLAVEKALKGLFQRRLGSVPPKTHNLQLLLDRTGVQVSPERGQFLVRLTQLQIATRYTEDLGRLQREFTATIAADMLAQAREVVEWAKTQP